MTDEHRISLQPGTIVAGKYEVVKCLGSGSMGLVYACRQRELSGRMVAVKVLFPEVAQDKVAAARFRNEVLASYEVSHPNVVRAYEYVRDGDLVGYTMEYVGGGDLAERLSSNDAKIPVAEVLKLLGQMCAGVQAIHDAGIVHRDIKPENILITKDGNVKITDFGIARNRHGPKLTEHGGVVGTIEYVAPEYMLNSQVDWRSDIYALGILGYEMLTGEAPFQGDSAFARINKRLKTDPDLPSKVRQDCPPSLDAVILKAMTRDPQQRYQSAMAMYADLKQVADEIGASLGSMPDRNESAPPKPTSDYVGPSAIAEHGIAAASDSSGGAQQSYSQPSHISSWADIGPGTQATESSDDFSYGSANSRGLDESNRSATQIMSASGIDNAMGVAAERSPSPPEMEQVLAYETMISNPWQDSEDKLGPGKVNHAVKVQDLFVRIKEQESKKSYLLDLVVLVVAGLVGVVMGLFILHTFLPDLLPTLPFLKG